MTEVSFSKQFLALLDARPLKLSSDYVADPRQLPAQPAYILPRNSKPYTKRPPPSQKAPTSTTTSNPRTDDTTTAPASQPPQTTTITLKTIRPTTNTPTTLTLPAQPLQNSIFDLKSTIARRTGFATDKIKVLWEKRPVSDSKTLAEVVGAAAAGAEMGVMYVGAPTAAPVPEEPEDGQGAAQMRPVPNADAAAMDAAMGKDTGVAGGGAVGDVDMKGAGADDGGAVAQGKNGWDVCRTDEFWEDLGSFVTQRVRDEEVAKKLVAGFRRTWEASV